MKKAERQRIVSRIISAQVIETQQQLLTELQRAGVKATQATVSRDIREMNIVKAKGADGRTRYVIYSQKTDSSLDKLLASIRDNGLSITRVQFLNVIHTVPSNGNLLAALIDDIEFTQVVGTVAGHDTIVVISPDEDGARWFNQLYQRAFGNA
ncbi:arginine repressor [Lacticaseibacillus thailandensis]|uniref:Arginine repressor n=1 Tax=Lacticaseibacillus thailandensis DSM 22698 = JCM 13996 TaxID=1423810 RepID=A0A0R2C9B7_9LACO|nr:ArgR family transcriptional regulator [Lacticaseibacillus thailandensis]KRM87962.1 arginine repressor [Lacticaseibacillus thailandensis DSM 22698 = JCM 13996]